MKKQRMRAPVNGNPSRRSARLADVASLLNVSTATVSRAFMRPELVTEELRNKVLAAAHQVGYAPNAAARALRLQRTRLIGVLVPTMDYAIYSQLINAIETTMAEANYLVLIATTGFDGQKILEKIRVIIESGAEAIICVGRVEDKQLKSLLSDRRIPLVSTYNYDETGPFPSIGFDNFEAAASVGRHLRELGHERVAVLLGPLKNNERQERRIAGYKAGFEVDGLHRIDTMIECVYKLEEGGRAFDRIRQEFPHVTAIVCSSDVLAAGVILRCNGLGLSIPNDISLVGFDDIELLATLSTPLTTVHVPALEMGTMAANAVIECLDNGTDVTSVKLPTSLLERKSVAVLTGAKEAKLENSRARA